MQCFHSWTSKDGRWKMNINKPTCDPIHACLIYDGKNEKGNILNSLYIWLQMIWYLKKFKEKQLNVEITSHMIVNLILFHVFHFIQYIFYLYRLQCEFNDSNSSQKIRMWWFTTHLIWHECNDSVNIIYIHAYIFGVIPIVLTQCCTWCTKEKCHKNAVICIFEVVIKVSIM